MVGRILRRYRFCLLLLVWLVSNTNLVAQTDTAKDVEKKDKQQVPGYLKSPRSTLQTFLEAVPNEDYARAATCLDYSLTEIDAGGSKTKSVCNKLYVLLNDVWRIQSAQLPSESTAASISMDAAIGVIDSPDAARDAAKISIAQVNGKWLITSDSVDLVDNVLYDKWVAEADIVSESEVDISFPMWLESQVPPTWRNRSFLIKDYQWVALVLLVLLGFGVDRLSRAFLNLLTRLVFPKVYEGNTRKQLWRPVGLLLNALTWYFAASLIDLPASFLTVLLVGLKFFSVCAFIWTAFSAIDLLSDYLLQKAKRKASRYEYLLVPFVQNGLKILAVCIGLIVFVDVFALNWTSLLGGFGLGGIAIAIASKDVLGNVFGSLTVLADRPFEIGDWIITEGVEGEVETVGMRSSRIRTFYNSLVVVPNSLLTTAIVDNMGRRHYRRVKTVIGVEYGTTPDQLEAFCEGIRELIRTNQSTRKDSFHVYVNGFGASSIDILVYFFLKTPDWANELHEKHKILINIVKVAQELKVNFAFPTQTLHLTQIDGEQDALPEFDSPRAYGKEVASNVVK